MMVVGGGEIGRVKKVLIGEGTRAGGGGRGKTAKKERLTGVVAGTVKSPRKNNTAQPSI